MNHKKLILLTLCSFACMNHGFNVSYDGKNPYVSYETSWGKERFVKEDYIKYFPFYEKYVEALRILHPHTINIKNLPYPYCQLQQILPFYGRGMYFNYKFIKKIFQHNNIVHAIEIGALYGLSTRHIASLLPDNGKLLAIDPWDYHAGMYEQFLSNVVLTGLTSKIVPIQKRSDQTVNDVKSYSDSFDLIYVDGDHETAGVLSDLELYYPLLTKNTGVICGDDWLLKTVRAAVQQFAEKNQLTIYAACNFWFLRDEGKYQYKTLIDADESIWMFNK